MKNAKKEQTPGSIKKMINYKIILKEITQN